VSRQVLALFCVLVACNWYSTNRPEAWEGSYRSTGAPVLDLELRADGTVVERIGGRELEGSWALYSISDQGCGQPTSGIELAGLVFDPREPQTNNRIEAHLEGWPRRLVLDLDRAGPFLRRPPEGAKKLELRRVSTPQ
jgi:hypothetical protein